MTLKQEEQEHFFYQGCSYYPLSMVLNAIMGEYGYYISNKNSHKRAVSRHINDKLKKRKNNDHKKIYTIDS